MDRSRIAKRIWLNRIAPWAVVLALLACCASPVLADSMFEPTDWLPPMSGYSSMWGSVTFSVPGAGTATLSGLTLLPTDPLQQKAPPAGMYTVDSFFDVFTELTLDLPGGGGPHHYTTGPASVAALFGATDYYFDNGYIRQFPAEMLSMNLSGGGLPAGVMIRESPTMASHGGTTIASVGGGFAVDSFFDVFTELSVDSGATWIPSDIGPTGGPLPLRIDTPAPEPGTIVLLAAGLVVGAVWVVRRRRR